MTEKTVGEIEAELEGQRVKRPLSSPRHEHFCQLIVEGYGDLDAYEEAGFKRHKGSASRLRNSTHICERIEQLRERNQKRHDVTIESILDELDDALCLSRRTESPSSMIAATKAKAQLMGLWVERAENLNQNHNYVISDQPEEQTSQAWLEQNKPT